MKKRIYVYATRFENLNPGGDAMWKERDRSKFVIELSSNLCNVASMTDATVFAKMLESKATNTEKYFYESHEIEPDLPTSLGTEEEYVSATAEITQ